MRFTVRFEIGGRLGAGSKYSLRDICVSLVDRYSIKDRELNQIVIMKAGESIRVPGLQITRVK